MDADELSLEELGRAFAQVMRKDGPEPQKPEPQKPEPEPESEPEEDADWAELPEEFAEEFEALPDTFGLEERQQPTLGTYDGLAGQGDAQLRTDDLLASEVEDDHRVPVTPATVLESMLFVGNPENQPLLPEVAADLMRGVTVEEIHALVAGLNAKYERHGAPWEIRRVAGGYLMLLREEFASLRETFFGKIRQVKLSQAALDVLAIVAYEQPLTLEEITQLRGVPCAGVLSQLVRRQLLRVQKVRRGTKFQTVYYTTDRFLQLFELESLGDLPQSEDLDMQ